MFLYCALFESPIVSDKLGLFRTGIDKAYYKHMPLNNLWIVLELPFFKVASILAVDRIIIILLLLD